jgi:hypothetical protein
LADLGEHGCDVRRDDHSDEAWVVVPDEWTTRTFFATAGRHAILLTGLELEEEDLEAVYHRLISTQ